MKFRFLPLLSAFFVLVGCGKRDAAPTTRPVFTGLVEVAGTSMLPAFSEHEIVALELCDYGDLRGGDTVVFWHDGSRTFTHHRLFTRDDTGRWVTAGDNNPGTDRGHMTRDEFVGRTHRIRR